MYIESKIVEAMMTPTKLRRRNGRGRRGNLALSVNVRAGVFISVTGAAATVFVGAAIVVIGVAVGCGDKIGATSGNERGEDVLEVSRDARDRLLNGLALYLLQSLDKK